jgi:hypothetical protein
MKNSTEVDELKNKIALLYLQQERDLLLLKEQFCNTCENLKPINLIKNTFKEVVASPSIKNTLVKNAIGLATGYLSKKLLIGSSHNPIKKVLGTVLEFVVANVVANSVDTDDKLPLLKENTH